MKQHKQKKIKRYRRSFTGQAERSLVVRRVLRFTVFLVVLFLLGWLIAKPGIDLGTKLWYSMKAGFTQGDASLSAPVSAPPASSMPETAPPESTPSETVPAALPTSSGGNWAYVALSAVDSPERASETARTLASQGVSAAVLPLKDERGFLYYPSALPSAKANISDATYDAAAAAKIFMENGITPIASIYAFKDASAPKQNRNMAVTYMDKEGFLWLNNKAEMGGVPWLNPYSAEANAYITDVIAEALSLGFKEIIVSGVQFPSGFGLDLAGYRVGDDTRDKAKVLADCVSTWQAQCKNAGAVCWFEYSSVPALGSGDAATVANPFTYGAEHLLLDFADSVKEVDGVMQLDSALFAAAAAKSAQNGAPALAMRISGGKLSGDALLSAASAANDAGFVSAAIQ